MPRPRRSRSSVAVAIQPAIRCAVYTRKSTDEGLSRDFNSLDNQRDRAEAYAASQENWSVLPDRYDDGGFSGGNTERPGLKRLLADVEAGRIQAVAVYRLDRLSRSIADFVNLHQFLEDHGVALISVTESINSRTPHGRMMINMLLSFAQYERELAAERTRHKIESARRRGQWTGGRPILGYDVVDGKLVVNKTEADQVVAIYEMFFETPSLIHVAGELNHRGWTQKRWTTKNGNVAGGGAWNRVSLRRLLTDPLNIGMQKLGDETFRGVHAGIVPKVLFQRVQRILSENETTRVRATPDGTGFILRGLLRCSACDAAMVPSPTKRHGKLHRYYRCHHAERAGHAACPSKMIPAGKVEQFVVDQIRGIGADPALQQATFEQAVAQIRAQRRGLQAEKKRLERDLVTSRADVDRLVDAVSRVTGPPADAIAAELSKVQQHVQTVEARMREIDGELGALKGQEIDRDEVARALAEFDPVWDVLLAHERERVMHLLIDHIGYDGGTGQLAIQWRLAGFGELAAEIGP